MFGDTNKRGGGRLVLEVPRELWMAHMFYAVAAFNESEGVAKKRDKLTKRMTSSQLEKAQDIAGEWMQNYQ